MKRFLWPGAAILIGAAAFVLWRFTARSAPDKTVADRLAEFGPVVRERLAADFRKAGVSYPPTALAFIGIKRQRRLEVFAAGPDGTFRFIRAYPILGASGKLGPKLREGDSQVPEGIYGVEWLNPNSAYHLSMRLDYPNRTDRAQAESEGRTGLGGDIMIHGSDVSIGCLAMGDQAAEDLFVLAALAGVGNVRVIIAPVDFRVADDGAPSGPEWVAGLYREIKKAMTPFVIPSEVENRAERGSQTQSARSGAPAGASKSRGSAIQRGSEGS